MMTSPQPASKGFSRAFWVSSTVELFERMAYYAVFIVLTIYLSNILAYIIHSGFISGYQNRYGDNLKPPTNVYHRMTA